jgi:hypothetical protein
MLNNLLGKNLPATKKRDYRKNKCMSSSFTLLKTSFHLPVKRLEVPLNYSREVTRKYSRREVTHVTRLPREVTPLGSKLLPRSVA